MFLKNVFETPIYLTVYCRRHQRCHYFKKLGPIFIKLASDNTLSFKYKVSRKSRKKWYIIHSQFIYVLCLKPLKEREKQRKLGNYKNKFYWEKYLNNFLYFQKNQKTKRFQIKKWKTLLHKCEYRSFKNWNLSWLNILLYR